MTNCNYSEHTKIQRKEIQKQIEELQAKLEELENQEPQMTLDKSGNIDVVSYNQKYYYRMGFASTGRSWLVRNIGHTALIMVDDPETLVKLEQLYEDMILDTGGVEEPEEGTWKYDPDAKFIRKQEPKENEWKSVALRFGEKLGSIGPCGYYEFSPDEWFEWVVNTYEKLADDWLILLNKEKQLRTLTEKLQKKDWKVDVKTNLKSHWEPKPQEPEEVAEGLKKAFREAVKQGVVSFSTKPQTLYEICMDWWRDLYSTADMNISIEKLVNRIEKEWLPKPIEETCGLSENDVDWTIGYNNYRDALVEKLK